MSMCNFIFFHFLIFFNVFSNTQLYFFIIIAGKENLVCYVSKIPVFDHQNTLLYKQWDIGILYLNIQEI